MVTGDGHEPALDPWPLPGRGGDDGPALHAALTPDLLGDRYRRHLGGQLQRVSILRGVLARPRVLVADEITAALDPVIQAAIWRRLLEICHRTGLSLVAISHDAALLDRIAGCRVCLPGSEGSANSEPIGWRRSRPPVIR